MAIGRRERISDSRLAELADEANRLKESGMDYRDIGQRLGGFSSTTAYYLANGCRNSREYGKRLEERTKYYSKRISKKLGDIPLSGYSVRVEKGKRSYIVRFSEEENAPTKEGVIEDFNELLAICEEAIGAGPFKIKLAYKPRELKMTPSGIEASAFLTSFAEKAAQRKVVKPK